MSVCALQIFCIFFLNNLRFQVNLTIYVKAITIHDNLYYLYAYVPQYKKINTKFFEKSNVTTRRIVFHL